ncbi:cytochrome c [Bacillus infantis]|uniref:c-type cytochrome n=1 Tax=Bacillus infantis TaxID=324767 RepID=UPI00344C6679
MTYVKVTLKIFKILFQAAFTLLFLGILFVKAVEWGMYFSVVKPKAEEIASDLSTYVEANNNFLTSEWLKSYVNHKKNSEYLDDNERMEVRYTQYANDRRFKIQVSLRAEYLDGNASPIATIETQSINMGETPTTSIFGKYGDLYSINNEMLVEENEKERGSQYLEGDMKKEEGTIVLRRDHGKKSFISEDEINEFIEEYVELGIEAINKNDFSYIEHMLDPFGESYKQSQDAIKKINSQVKQEELLDFKTNNVILLDESTYKVSTFEEYRVTYNDGKVMVKGYNSDYLLKLVDEGHLALNKTLNINEVSNYVSRAPAHEIYKQTCVSCHGINYEGGVGPSLYNVGSKYSEDEILNILINGKGSMPQGLISKEEASSMALYLMELEGE